MSKQQTEKSFRNLMSKVDDAIYTNKNKNSSNNNQTIETKKSETQNTENKENKQIIENENVVLDKQNIEIIKNKENTVEKSVSMENKNEENLETKRIKYLIEDYLKFNTGTIMKSEKDKMIAGKKFRDILLYSIDNPTKSVLDTVYKFFKTYKNKILVPQLVLPGTLNISSSIAERINCMYTLFMMITGTKQVSINTTTVRMLMGKLPVSKMDAILMYMQQKLK